MMFAPLVSFIALLKQQFSEDGFPMTQGEPNLDGVAVLPTFFEDREIRSSGNGDRYFSPTHYAASPDNRLSDNGFSDRRDGVVTIAIHPHRLGQVKYEGTWWSARCGRALVLEPGTLVNVIARENITLIVEPMGMPPHTMGEDKAIA